MAAAAWIVAHSSYYFFYADAVAIAAVQDAKKLPSLVINQKRKDLLSFFLLKSLYFFTFFR